VVEREGDLLLQEATYAVFEQNLAHAKAQGNERWVRTLQAHLDLLRAVERDGIEAAFAAREASAEAQGEQVVSMQELVQRSVAALTSDAEDRRAHYDWLSEQRTDGQNPRFDALIDALQGALVGGSLEELGQELEGPYRQTWAIIVDLATCGISQEGINELAVGTLAALSAPPEARADWGTRLGDLEARYTQAGNERLARFVAALRALLAAEGDPEGLGDDLDGIFAVAWSEILKMLEKR
jgi:hypothetical protein